MLGERTGHGCVNKLETCSRAVLLCVLLGLTGRKPVRKWASANTDVVHSAARCGPRCIEWIIRGQFGRRFRGYCVCVPCRIDVRRPSRPRRLRAMELWTAHAEQFGTARRTIFIVIICYHSPPSRLENSGMNLNDTWTVPLRLPAPKTSLQRCPQRCSRGAVVSFYDRTNGLYGKSG